MKPLFLSIDGFTAFKNKQELDFTRLDVFVLFGPTGSGKSSVLDAMCYALYGRVPRLGATNLSDLISTGRDAATITFDFQMRGNHYRVTRKMYRSTTPARAQVDRVDGENITPVSSGVTETSKKIEDILGLDFAAFSRSVMLPQGKFAEFLHAAGSERRAMIKSLFGLGVLDRMRGLVTVKTKDIEDNLNILKGRTTGIGDPAEIQAELVVKRQELGEIQRLKAELGAELAAKSAELEVLRELANNTAELARVVAELAALVLHRGAIVLKEEELRRAIAAERILPVRDSRNDALKNLKTRQSAAENANKELLRVQSSVDGSVGRVARAKEASERLPDLEARLATLNALQAKLQELEKLRDVEGRAVEALSNDEQSFANAQKSLCDAEAKFGRAQEDLKTKQAELSAIGFDSGRLEQLLRINPVAANVLGLTAQVDAARRLRGESESKIADHKVALEHAREALNGARQKDAEAQSNLAVAEDALKAAERENQAAVLRKNLCEGDSCPVCHQTVPVIPATESFSLESLESALKAARTGAKATSEASQKANTSFELAQERHERVVQDSVVASEAFEAKQKALTEALFEFERLTLPGLEPAQVAAAIEAERELSARVQSLKSTIENAGQMLELLKTAAADSKVAVEREKSRVDVAKERAEQAIAAVRAYESNLGVIPENIAQEITACTTEIKTIQEELKAAEAKLQSERELLQRCEALAGSARTELDAATKHFEDTNAKFVADLQANDFGSEEILDASIRSAKAREDLEREIKAHHNAKERCEGRRAELAEKLSDARVSDEQVADTQGRIMIVQGRLSELTREEGSWQQAIYALDTKLKELGEVAKQLKVAEAEYALFRDISQLLRDDAFPEFVADSYLKVLVAGASHRLKELSGRYSLLYQDSTFLVMDHDNGDQTRRATTLSGGETFLASLSLALELAAQVQLAQGATQLDSLFIDEGFGTLDAATLDTVAEAIESLGSHRTVGIVTHVEELMLRLPNQVMVRKGPDTSHLEVTTR
jgi:exonuclease SbcC